MRILLIRRGLFPPDLFAGSEMNLYWLCRMLAANGHEIVAATCAFGPADAPAVLDPQCGFPVYRAPDLFNSVPAALAQFEPDVFVVTECGPWVNGLPERVLKGPLVIYEQDVSSSGNDMAAEIRAHAQFVANSPACQRNLKDVLGVESVVVRPLFGVDRYAGIERTGENVLFVSLQLRKGADVAIRIAQARPNVPFIFVESWTRDATQTQALRDYVSGIPNITRLANQPGLADVMPMIKLLLMPSRSQESWGRTATEAQICGIPVLGTARGNLPATIGEGGVTLDPDEPIERWLAAFDRIMDDPSVYEDLSRKAREHGREMTQEIERAYRTFEQVLHDTAVRGRA